MTSVAIGNLERMIVSGRDNALLRFSLGNEYLKISDAPRAAEHLEKAVSLDAGYSAAWKLLGRAWTECGRFEDAISAYEKGITVAESKGDKQAAKEMQVFAKRLRKQQGTS
jgi:Tfp pilus assembly protein PilF